MALRPPQHRVDAPIVYIHPNDDAWDLDRVRAEQETMDKPAEHPVAKYMGGFTRYDLNAKGMVGENEVCPADYIDEAKEPVKWHLKRLNAQQWYEVQPIWERAVRRDETPWDAYLRCGKYGVSKVDGLKLDGPPGNLTADDVKLLYKIDPELLKDVGEAVYSASLPLREDEKKR